MSTPSTLQPLKVACILATGKKGCTHHFSEHFLQSLAKGRSVEIARFVLPKDAPAYCTGCMACFTRGMDSCPHLNQVQPIWQAMLAADLVLLAQPAYVMGPPGQMKALLDHLACRWLVHSPDPAMLNKRVLILSQAVGLGGKKAGKAVKTSMRFLGAAKVHLFSFTVKNVIYDHIPAKKRTAIQARLDRLARKLSAAPATLPPSLFARVMFPVMRLGHSLIVREEKKQGREETYDYLYWKKRGWLDKQYPWKQG